MADLPFRVLLDLTDLHFENFKYVWVNVSPRELKTISDFKISLLHKINLGKTDIRLFVRDGLLLDEETITVLREDDTVKVQYEEHGEPLSIDNSDKKSEKFSRKRNLHEFGSSEIPLNPKKYSTDNDILNKSNEIVKMNNEKKKKHKKSHNSVSLDKVIVHSEILEKNNRLKSHKKDKNSSLLENDISDSNLIQNDDSFFSFSIADPISENCEKDAFSVLNAKMDNITFDSTKDSSPKMNGLNYQEEKIDLSESTKANTEIKIHEESNNCVKRKRKRHRKRKKTESTVIDISNNIDIDKFISLSDAVNENVEKKHIMYSSSPYKNEKMSSAICEDSDLVQNCSTDTFVRSEDVSNVNAQWSKDYPKMSTPTQSDGCSNPSWHIFSMQYRNSVHNLPTCKKEYAKNSTHDKMVVKKNVPFQNCEENNIPSKLQYSDLPALNSMPEIGTHIVYKTLELDESYSPVISDYREGIVKDVNPDTEEMKIELFKEMIKPGRTGKFENLQIDEIPPPEIKTYDILRWSAIISPKRLA